MVEPLKKKSNTKKILLGSFLGTLIGLVFGVTVAMFSYNSSSVNSKLIAGDIYMKYKETSAINLSGAMPSATYPSAATGNYFEFQIIGKNTSSSDITYNVKLAYGDEISGKDRINDKHLLFKLVEVINNEEQTPIVNDKSFTTIPGATLYTAKILKNTNNETTRTFRVYARISENVGIGTNTTYTTQEWNNLYASVKINVDGTSITPAGEIVKANIKSNNTSSTCQNATLTWTDPEDNITYISGSTDCIDFNYLWYSGKMWRITAIYPDGAMKLVTDNNITSIAFNESASSDATKVNFYNSASDTSYMYQWLNEDFYDTLYNASNIIDTTKQWNATMPENTNVSTKPGNTNLVTANVGLLNNYEYYNSYRCNGSSACSGSSYSAGYLNIGYYWWLLNPYSSSYVWGVNGSGSSSIISPTDASAVRPSINLLSTVKILGTGTKTNPYRVVGDKEVGTTGNDLNTRQVGEYVKLKSGDNEQVFRIVSFENNTTKLIALDYVDGGNTTKTFATANSSGNGTIFGEGNTVDDTNNTTWYSYLKNVYISDLKTKYDTNPSNSMFTSGNYYLGINADNASDTTYYYNYRTSICASTSDLSKNCPKSRSKSLEAGLLRYGEMFASQHGIGYNTKTSTYNTESMWLMTRRTASYVWDVYGNGGAYRYSPTDTSVGRPSINLSSGVKIVACDTDLCDGTPNHPYVVGL